MQSVTRLDAKAKADGTVLYTDDLEFSGLYGAIIRSSIPYGEILSIEFDPNFDFTDLTIVDHKDIKGSNINSMLEDNQPFLASKIVKFIGDPILLIAHKNKELLDRAKKHIDIRYKEYEPVLSLDEAVQKKNIVFGTDNIFKSIATKKGNEPNYSSLHTLEKTYTTPYQEHLYLETQNMIARYQNNGYIKIIGSMQCPFYVESALRNLTNETIEVEQAVTGGAFGGKEDYPSLMEAYVYLLSKKAKQDVKIVYDREEDIAFSTKRHPSKLKYKSFFNDKGKLHALHINIEIDGGAYCTLSPVVLSRAVLHCAGFYDCEYIQVNGVAVATNTPPSGAFRGFGAPQVIFGIERHMDDIARFLKLSPLEIRRVNMPTENSLSVTNTKIDQYKRLNELFEYTCKQSGIENQNKNEYEGWGISLFMHGGGFTGIGEVLLKSSVLLELSEDGTIDIKIGSVEMGQGTLTVLPQIVAEALDLPLFFVRYNIPNTVKVADSGPTVASRTVMIVGELLKQAAKELKETIGKYDNLNEYKKAVRQYTLSEKTRSFRAFYKKPQEVEWDEEHFYGNGYDEYSLGCHIAKVAVDSVDYSVNVKEFYAYHDVGEVVNLTLAEGQVHGGVAQGIGYALYENIHYKEGKIKNNKLRDYIIPMACDLPNIDVKFLGTDKSAKGLGELPMNGPAAAITNAVIDATGVEFDSIPLFHEMVGALWR